MIGNKMDEQPTVFDQPNPATFESLAACEENSRRHLTILLDAPGATAQ